MKTFEKGQVFINPSVGLIKFIGLKEIDGKQFFAFEPLCHNYTKIVIMIPQGVSDSIDIRSPVDSKTAEQIWEKLKTKTLVKKLKIEKVPGFRKVATYDKIILSFDINKLAGLVVYFYCSQQKNCSKQLSSSAQEYYNKARKLLIRELAYSLGQSEEEIDRKLQKLLEKHHLPKKKKKLK